MNRKQRRAQEALLRKDNNEELATKVALLGKLPEECTACEAVYDKKDKEMATTWNVVVREQDKDNPVRLYCPMCWSTAQEVINNFLKTMEEEDGS
jgi:bacterioferritin-associated ferredoxin